MSAVPEENHKDYSYGYDNQSAEDMRSKMVKGWRSTGDKTPCGQGSLSAPHTINAMLKANRQHDVRTVANVGAGDLFWWSDRELLNLFTTQHYDLVPRNDAVIEFDCTKEIVPRVDMILCRYVLNHLSAANVQRSLENFKASGTPYLMLTHKPLPQGEYWAKHGIRLGKPLFTILDYDRWEIGLFKLADIVTHDEDDDGIIGLIDHIAARRAQK